MTPAERAERLLTIGKLARLTHRLLGAHAVTFRDVIADAIRTVERETWEEAEQLALQTEPSFSTRGILLDTFRRRAQGGTDG